MEKIRAYTLFDITRTNVKPNRYGSTSNKYEPNHQAEQQANFETVLQILGIRSQPENITDPEKKMIPSNCGTWGSDYCTSTKVPVWTFEFTVNHSDVYAGDGGALEKLFSDCQSIPMITGLGEYVNQNTLSVLKHNKNIHFEVVK